MAITIEELIEGNLILAHPWAHDVHISKVDDNHYLATVEFWMDNDLNVRVIVSDEEEITAIEEL